MKWHTDMLYSLCFAYTSFAPVKQIHFELICFHRNVTELSTLGNMKFTATFYFEHVFLSIWQCCTDALRTWHATNFFEDFKCMHLVFWEYRMYKFIFYGVTFYLVILSYNFVFANSRRNSWSWFMTYQFVVCSCD